MIWEVAYTDQFGEWWDSLGQEEQEAVTAAVNVLQRGGPSLGRPLVDTIKQSRHKNMKELIPPASDIRVLFAFDPRRAAILLIGGDTSGEWNTGTTGWSPLPTNSSTSIFASSRVKEPLM